MDDQPRVGQRVDLIVRFHVDEIQQLASTATAGAYRLTHRGRTTDPIPWDATAQDVEEALERLTTIGPGGVICWGGRHPATPISIRFSGLAGKRSQPDLLVDVTGLTGTVAVSTTQPGGPTAPDAAPTIQVDPPDAAAQPVTPVTALGAGAYQANYTPTTAGLHRWSATATSSTFGPVEAEATFTVAPSLVA